MIGLANLLDSIRPSPSKSEAMQFFRDRISASAQPRSTTIYLDNGLGEGTESFLR